MLELGAAEHLDVDQRQAPQQRGDDDQQGAGIERLEAGTEDHEGANEAARDGSPAPPTKHLAEEEGAQEGGEERASEGECGGAGQRSEREADEEGEHGEHVEHRTQHVEADALGVEEAKTVAHEQGKDHNEAENVAEEGHLHGRKTLAGVADGGVHGREHDGREQHQQAGARHR